MSEKTDPDAGLWIELARLAGVEDRDCPVCYGTGTPPGTPRADNSLCQLCAGTGRVLPDVPRSVVVGLIRRSMEQRDTARAASWRLKEATEDGPMTMTQPMMDDVLLCVAAMRDRVACGHSTPDQPMARLSLAMTEVLLRELDIAREALRAEPSRHKALAESDRVPGHCADCERSAQLSIVRLATAEALELAAKNPAVLLSMLEEMAAYLRGAERPADWQWFGRHLIAVLEAVNDVGAVVAGRSPEGTETASIRGVRVSRRGPTKRDAKIAKMLQDYLAMERRLRRAEAQVEAMRTAANAVPAEWMPDEAGEESGR